MQRPPDSPVTAGQRLEDELDAITDSTRRDTTTWIRRLMRARPGDPATLSAIISGIAGGILDQVHENARGEPDQIRSSWQNFVDFYLGAMREDAAADQEPGAQPPAETAL